MIPGFIEVDRHTFYGKIWLRICNEIEAVESNWAAAKKGERPIVIKWGYKDENTGEKIVVAVTHTDDINERHWVDKSLLAD